MRFNSLEERQKALNELRPVLGDSIVELMNFKKFCEAPASTKYHGAYAGGLFDHSYEVGLKLKEYTDKLGLKWLNPNSPMKIGLLHDLCKIDLYKYNTEENKYEYNNDVLVKGHAEKSIIYTLRANCPLTKEEMVCILYHMGVYGLDRTGMDDFNKACRQFPNVLYTHMADVYVSQVLEL